MTDGEITIQGRALKPVKNGTFEHDTYAAHIIVRSGMAMVTPMAGEDESTFRKRIALHMLTVDSGLDILAALLMPAEMSPADWTPETARDMAAFLRKVLDPEAKRTLHLHMWGILEGFFANAPAYTEISRRSSTPVPGRQGAVGGIEDVSGTANGT